VWRETEEERGWMEGARTLRQLLQLFAALCSCKIVGDLLGKILASLGRERGRVREPHGSSSPYEGEQQGEHVRRRAAAHQGRNSS
jgi:hypothetical protein